MIILVGVVLAAAAASDAPVIWMAPFLSGGGYSSEAISYAIELEKVVPNFSTVQFAEQVRFAVWHPPRTSGSGMLVVQADPAFSKGLPADVHRTLQRHARTQAQTASKAAQSV
jgi:hypothetical protein